MKIEGCHPVWGHQARILPMLGILLVPAVAFAQPAVVTRAEILPRASEMHLLTVQATGVQIYTCMPDANGSLGWTFTAPRARLRSGGKRVGTHDAGPVWEHFDGSMVRGQPVARADPSEPGAIPWLRLDGVETSGPGILGAANVILRTNTKGGTMTGACKRAGKRREQPYSSDYVFLKRN